MSDIKHTPGPWRSHKDDGFILQVNIDELPIAMARGWGWLSKKYGEKEAIKIQEANLKLMAAAPDLLAMLSHAVEWIEEHHGETHDTKLYKAAIKKATE